MAADDQARVAVVTGAGKAFSAGGDLAMVERMAGDYDKVTRMLTEMSDLVYNMINCAKPVVSAINGVAVGAGLVVALLADVSICAADARLATGTSGWGRWRAITRPSSGRCCAAWPGRATTC